MVGGEIPVKMGNLKEAERELLSCEHVLHFLKKEIRAQVGKFRHFRSFKQLPTFRMDFRNSVDQ